jgi:DNA-binding response OmpR family regulator
MSGHTYDALGAEDLGIPLTGFLAKPFTPDELLAAVRALLDAARPGGDAAG